jgi:hypothetical protein
MDITRIKTPAVLAGTFVLGGGAGYFFAKKTLETKYAKIATEEIAEARQYFTTNVEKPSLEEVILEKNKKAFFEEVVDNHRQVFETVADKIEEYDQVSVTVREDFVEVVNNVFTDSDNVVWSYQDEMEKRSDDKPYVIHFDEWTETIPGYEQVQLTYYDEDDTLADSQDVPIDAVEQAVGRANLERFGHGSNDESVVYVRNEAIATDFEIVKTDGSYSREVLGIDDELQHSYRPKIRKFRPSDE